MVFLNSSCKETAAKKNEQRNRGREKKTEEKKPQLFLYEPMAFWVCFRTSLITKRQKRDKKPQGKTK
jgi:hypothetical protein